MLVQEVPGVLATGAQIDAPSQHLRQRVELARPDAFRLNVVAPPAERRKGAPDLRDSGLNRRSDDRQLVAGSRVAVFLRPRFRRLVASQSEPDYFFLSVFEQHVRAGAKIGQGAAEHQPPFKQISRFERLPQDQQRLNDAALAHPVEAAQQIQRRTR